MLFYIITSILLVFALGSVFIYMLERKITQLETVILRSFRFRTSLIPALFEATQSKFSKHDLVFRHILSLRTRELLYQNNQSNLDDLIHIEEKIHKELNFIFKVANKHPKLLKDAKFIYTRDLFVDCSYYIGRYLDTYKKIITIYNNYVTVKNYTIVGLLLPLSRKDNI